jgi:peptidoglycan/LPS O-acetylase OafA/YrhL
MDTKRLNYLDSIRGVAACVVLLSHCWLASTNFLYGGVAVAFSSITNFIHYNVEKLLAGRAAVMIFFVLSGFVLAYSLQKNPMTYAGFAIKRIFRIYPAFLFVVLSSYALHLLIGFRHDVGSQVLREDLINTDLSVLALVKHLALLGTTDSIRLDGVIWSLVPEMRISLIFPLILLSVRKYGLRAVTGYWLFSLACTTFSFYVTGQNSTGYDETTITGSMFATGYFIVFFALGALLAIERERVVLKIANLPRWMKVFLFAVVTGCLLKSSRDLSSLKGIATDYISGIGAFGLIAAALGVRKFRVILNHKLPIWLGRISYSLYLVHVPILYAVNQTIGGPWLGLRMSAVVIVLSLLAAELMARLIEFPSVKLGKKLSVASAATCA